jgi:hypothetical protein
MMIAPIALLALATSLVSAAPSPPPSICSNDVFTIDDRSVSVALCVPETAPKRSADGKRYLVTVSEALSSRGATVNREVTLDFLAGAELSRTLDDVPLDKLGIAGTLHLTIGYRPGAIRLEHALLIPGAKALK